MLEVQEGLRVKVAKGDLQRDNWGSPTGRYVFNIRWIAGAVPVGSVGTIVRKRLFADDHPNNQTMFSIEFDEIKPERAGFRFGLSAGPLPDWLEVVA